MPRACSLYMSFITFSTVGLGDYAPGLDFFAPGRPEWFQAAGFLAGAFICMFGLALLSTLLGALELWVRKDISLMGINTMQSVRRNSANKIRSMRRSSIVGASPDGSPTRRVRPLTDSYHETKTPAAHDAVEAIVKSTCLNSAQPDSEGGSATSTPQGSSESTTA